MLTPKKKLISARTRLRQTQKVARAKNKVSKAVNKGKIAEMYGGNKTASGSVMKAKADIKLDKANNRLKKVTDKAVKKGYKAPTTTKPTTNTKTATKPATKTATVGKSTVELSKDNRMQLGDAKYFKKERTPLSRTPTKSKYTGSLPSTQKKTIRTKLTKRVLTPVAQLKLDTKFKVIKSSKNSRSEKRIPMKATPKSIPSAKRSLSIPKKISANTISSTNSKVRKRKK